MPSTRRTFLKHSAAVTTGAAALTVAPRPLLAHLGARPEPVPSIQDPRLKELVNRGLDALKSAGASYGEVRLLNTRTRKIGEGPFTECAAMNVGIRAFVNGFWGFAASPVWATDEMTRLGREAVLHAKANALGKTRPAELVPAPVVKDGHWSMPVKYDPFEIHPYEIMDVMRALSRYTEGLPYSRVATNYARFVVQEKAFGSTLGTYCTQRLYRSEGAFAIHVEKRKERKSESGRLDVLSPAGMGWELYRDQPLRDHIKQLNEDLLRDMTIPMKPLDVGRYDVVFDANTMASLLSPTVGIATELDRVMGYEANAGGTSYLSDPAAMLGTFKVGNPLLTVTANRSEPGGAATVAWDDEGVVPETFTLVRDGVLADYQTTRESAAWLADHYRAKNVTVRSHGCSLAGVITPEPFSEYDLQDRSGIGMYAPLTHTPNLVMTPGTERRSMEDLITTMGKGIAFRRLYTAMDFQQGSGLALPSMTAYEVKNGQRTGRLGAGVLFRATELWKELTALGGPESVRRFGFVSDKGEPKQGSYHSVTAVPALLKNVTVIDPLRRA